MSFALAGVSLRYANGFSALVDISLAAAAGEHIAVIGPSGAGKSTLLRLLGASLRPSSGQLEVLGQNPWALSSASLRQLRAKIGVVHQTPPLPQRQRVVTAVLAGRLGQWPLWKSLLSLLYPIDIDGAREALARLDLGERIFDRCDRISGGQLQRVGVARVLYQRGQLLLADEPVAALDPNLALQTLRALAADARARGAGLVASLHAVDLALAEFPRIVGLKEGRIYFDLPVAEVNESLLHELYAAEGSELPTLAQQPHSLSPAAAPPSAIWRGGSC